MDIETATPFAAFAAGLATSLHCAGMCGPLACAVRVRPASYHLARIASYAAAGALCGALGGRIVALVKGDATRLVPWALAAVLLVMGLGLERRLPQPRFLAALLLRARLARWLGWVTPLLPCGPLWLLLGVAVVTGSAAQGAWLAACFAAGTVPLYWLLQAQWTRLGTRVAPGTLQLAQRCLALASAGLLVWRAMLPANGCCH